MINNETKKREHLTSIWSYSLLLTLVESGYHELHGCLVDTEQSHQVWMLEEYLVIHYLTAKKSKMMQNYSASHS